MSEITSFPQYQIALRDFIRRSENAGFRGNEAADAEFNRLALALFRLQREAVAPFRSLCDARNARPENLGHWSEIPAMPASAFKEFDLTALPPGKRTRTFQSSGTTRQTRSRHYHDEESLKLYEASLLPWFRAHFLGDLQPGEKMQMVLLTPPPEQAPASSLVHMFATVRREFGASNPAFVSAADAEGNWVLDTRKAHDAMRQAATMKRPIAILGTAFLFVGLLDFLNETNAPLPLPAGSRILETGGYKGRTREVPKTELGRELARMLGVPPSHILSEYGMSELSSQAYDRQAGASGPGEGTFHFPPWARARIISPETGIEVPDGETGLIRVWDLANVQSVLAVQTEDLALRRGAGFELRGRAPHSEPRGCSLMAP